MPYVYGYVALSCFPSYIILIQTLLPRQTKISRAIMNICTEIFILALNVAAGVFWNRIVFSSIAMHLYGGVSFDKGTPKNILKITRIFFFNRVLAPGNYLDRFLLQNYVDSTMQISISIFLDPIRGRFTVFIYVSKFCSAIVSSGMASP